MCPEQYKGIQHQVTKFKKCWSQEICFHSLPFGESAAAKTDSESEDTLSASEGEGQGEGSVRVRSGSPGIDSQHGVVTIQGSGEVRMKKVDLPGELTLFNLLILRCPALY